MSPKNYAGLILIFLVVAVIMTYSFFANGLNFENIPISNNQPNSPVTGYLGWEKRGFFEDQEVVEIFDKTHNLDVAINKKGSIEMVSEPVGESDYLFPSNKIALEIYKANNSSVKSDTIFFSPMVIYSWKSLIPDLEKSGLVSQTDGVYTLDLDTLLLKIEKSETWQDIGASQLQGPLSISSTDPTKSSSGNLFSAMVLNSFVPGDGVVQSEDFTPEMQKRVDNFFDKMGLLDSSSGDIFSKFLTLGRSTYPFVVGYESQLIEVINEGRVSDEVVVLYPQSTVWAEHEFISLNDDGDKLLEALQTEERFGAIAWDRYGLRKVGTNLDNGKYKDYGVAKELKSVTPLPQLEVMQEVIRVLEE